MPLSLKREGVIFGLQVILTGEFFWKELKTCKEEKRSVVAKFAKIKSFIISFSFFSFSLFHVFFVFLWTVFLCMRFV